MHRNVHCSTVCNSKYLEQTQMPIDDRLERENVAHIHGGILCSHKKWLVHVLSRDMDKPGKHNSRQTDSRTENQTPHVLTHRWVLNNENTWTQGGEHYTLGSIGGKRGGPAGGELGRDSLGRNAKCGWRGERKQNTLPCVYLCNCLACSAHVHQNIKCNKKKEILGWAGWLIPILPALLEAEACKSLESRSSRPAWPTPEVQVAMSQDCAIALQPGQ